MMDCSYLKRHSEAIYWFKSLALTKAGDGMLLSDFFDCNVALSFRKDASGIRLTPSLTVLP